MTSLCFELQDWNENRNESEITITVDLNEPVKEEYAISVGVPISIFLSETIISLLLL